MFDLSSSWPWLSMAALGAFHGLNPAMGWLFAVALGLQERRLGAVIAALGPIALGHALAISTAALVVGLLGLLIPQHLLLALGGAALLGFAAYRIITRFRHPRWVGMRVNARQMVLWSFLMASAHGAGLMLIPALVQLRDDGVPATLAHDGHAGHHIPAATDALTAAVAAVGIHSLAMLAVAGLIAVVVYRIVGVEMLRRAWINLDLLWVGALAVTGSIALVLGLWPTTGA